MVTHLFDYKMGQIRTQVPAESMGIAAQTALARLSEVPQEEWEIRYELELKKQGSQEQPEIKSMLEKIVKGKKLDEIEVVKMGFLEANSLCFAFENILQQMGMTIQRGSTKNPPPGHRLN